MSVNLILISEILFHLGIISYHQQNSEGESDGKGDSQDEIGEGKNRSVR